jgi:ketosteroid isomerase-like protein
MGSTDVVGDLFPEAQAAVVQRVQDILAAVEAQDVDRLDSYHLFGPKYSKFDDGEPAGRQDAATAQQLERELVASAKTLRFRAEDLKVDVFGPVAVATLILDWAATMPDDQEYAARSRATLVFVDDGSEWKLVHEHFSAFPGAA